MNKFLVFILASLLAVNVASAVPIDSAPNSMGIYFDLDATIYETSAPATTFVEAHVIFTRPQIESLEGYGFQITIDGAHVIFATHLMGDNPVDIGPDYSPNNNHIVGLISPMITTPATLLCTLDVFLLDANPITLTLHGYVPGETSLPLLPTVAAQFNPEAILLTTGVSAGVDGSGFPNICAFINGTGVVATDQASWDQVKSLYR